MKHTFHSGRRNAYLHASTISKTYAQLEGLAKDPVSAVCVTTNIDPQRHPSVSSPMVHSSLTTARNASSRIHKQPTSKYEEFFQSTTRLSTTRIDLESNRARQAAAEFCPRRSLAPVSLLFLYVRNSSRRSPFPQRKPMTSYRPRCLTGQDLHSAHLGP